MEESFFDSEVYFNQLIKVSESINQLSRKAKSEADVISAFDSYFLPVLRSNANLNINYYREESIDIKRIVKKGRIDSRIGSLVIEFKHFSKFQTKKNQEIAINQIKNYLESLFLDVPQRYFGIITDGINSIKIIKDDKQTNVLPVEDFNAKLLNYLTKVIVSS